MNDLALYNEIKTARAGAVFSVHYVNPVIFDQLEEDGVPVILINNSNFQDRYWSILTDDIQGAYDGTKHLLDLGHRRIAYGEYKRSATTSVVRDRYFGFKRALDDGNIPFSEEYLISIDTTTTSVPSSTRLCWIWAFASRRTFPCCALGTSWITGNLSSPV